MQWHFNRPSFVAITFAFMSATLCDVKYDLHDSNPLGPCSSIHAQYTVVQSWLHNENIINVKKSDDIERIIL